MDRRFTGGVLVPLCSPCGEGDRFLPDRFREGLSLCLGAPIDGFYVCGGTGEGTKMRPEDRKAACELAVALSGDKKVLVQVGAADRDTALELARHAGAAGADGVSTVPLPGQIGRASCRERV